MLRGKLFSGGVISGFVSDVPPKEPEDIIGYGNPVVLLSEEEYDAQQAAIAAAEEANAPVADAIYNEQVEPRLKDVIILVEKIDALARLRAKEEI